MKRRSEGDSFISSRPISDQVIEQLADEVLAKHVANYKRRFQPREGDKFGEATLRPVKR